MKNGADLAPFFWLMAEFDPEETVEACLPNVCLAVDSGRL